MTTRSHQATVPLLTDDVEEQDGDVVCLDEHYPTPNDEIYLRSRKKKTRSNILVFAVGLVLMGEDTNRLYHPIIGGIQCCIYF